MEPEHSRLEPTVEGGLRGEETSLEVAAEHYLASKTKARGGGNYAHTAATALTRFVERMLDRGVATTGALDKHDLAAYAVRLKERVAADPEEAITAESARTYYNVVAGFLTWCVRRDLLATNYARKEVATSELPNAEGSGKQQFWSEATRERLLLYVDWKTEDVLRNGWMDERRALRDRAYVGMLALTGVRNGELLRSPRDGRREGLTWGDVDFDAGIVYVLGKSQKEEEVPLLDRSARWLRAHRRRLDSPPDTWPVFPTLHAPSRYSAARDGLRHRGHAEEEIETLLEAQGLDEVFRQFDIAPPALTTEGGRRILRELSAEAHLTEDGEPLKPHGARRGVGQTYYMQAGHEAAQKVLRHQDPAVTSRQYSHVEAGELREIGKRLLGDDRNDTEPPVESPATDDDVPESYR